MTCNDNLDVGVSSDDTVDGDNYDDESYTACISNQAEWGSISLVNAVPGMRTAK